MRPVTVSPDGGRRSITSLKASIPRPSDFQLIDALALEQLLESSHEECLLIEAHFSSADHPLAGIDQRSPHLPGAEYQGDWKNLVDQNSDKIGPLLDSVAQRWRDQGILDADVASGKRSLIFYCGTGWRSSIAFLVALSLGLRAKNYDDGFYGWSWDEENEIIYGETTPASR
ncbi:hypothetical protein GYB43_07020 [bacterium]|jgi:3-mercaptopyruvate sulfurtransferase SseA|nr:hypothetical protein [bacterium]